MLTLNQLCNSNKSRISKTSNKFRSKALKKCPFKKGLCVKVTTMKPKKPNSAVRKIAKVKLSTGRRVVCYIPGRGHDLREFSDVLVRGGHVPDLPGVQYHLVRGKYDFSWKENSFRRSARSKYGIPLEESLKFFNKEKKKKKNQMRFKKLNRKYFSNFTNNEYLYRLIQLMMRHGKYSTVYRIVILSLIFLKETVPNLHSSVKYMEMAIRRLEPTFYLRKQKKSKYTFFIPAPCRPNRRTFFAIKFLIETAKSISKREGLNLSYAIVRECMDVVKNNRYCESIRKKKEFLKNVLKYRYSTRFLKRL